MRKQNFLFFIFIYILLFLPISYAIVPVSTGDIYEEEFDYIDAFTNHGWTYSEDATCLPTSPATAKGYSGFGGETNGTCAGANWRYIRRDVADFVLTTAKDKIISFIYYNNITSVKDLLRIRMGANYGDNTFIFLIRESAFGNNNTVEVGGVAGRECTFNYDTERDEVLQYIIHFRTFDGLIDVYENNTKVCDGITGFTGQDLSNLEIYQKTTTSGSIRVMDNLLLANGSVGIGSSDCEFPIIFCDDFGYTSSLYSTKDWTVYNIDNSLNTGFSPIQSVCVFNKTQPKTIGHDYDRFETEYETDEGITTTASLFAPYFTNEFNINISNKTAGNIEFKAFDLDGDLCYIVQFRSDPLQSTVNISILNITTSLYDVIGSITPNKQTKINIISRFSSINKSYPFNTSVAKSHIDVYADEISYLSYQKTNLIYQDCENPQDIFFIRESGNYTLDDYYMYVGTDKDTSTLPIDIIPIYTAPDDIDETVALNGTRDWSVSVDNLWEQFGIRSLRSRIMFGLALILIFNLIFIAFMMKAGNGVHFGALIFVTAFCLILLTFLRLLPVWILVIMGILGAGVGAIMVKNQVAS